MTVMTVTRPKKRLFIGLLLASLVAVTTVALLFWLVSFAGLANISRYLPLVLGGILGCLLVLSLVGITGIILAILGFRTPKVFQNVAWTAINLLFPTAIRIGRWLDVEKERIERSFIEVSNHLVRQKQIIVPPDKLLILTPHCIQHDSCPHNITRNVHNCKRCGKCQVKDLLELTDGYGAHLAVVTGGTLARKMIQTLRPRAVLAIACERDLTSGIQDVFPLPVLGILNERPEGPCCNTRVDMARVRETVHCFLGRDD